ncbi:MAG TPA: hypothetical protein VHK90_09820 [Thermoanaerobaculia bacterium]|nr:hypothetical protein [Thermoanaerobaculia bacterium]
MTAKRLAHVFLVFPFVLGIATSAGAGVMHARAVIGLGVSSQTAGHYGVAHAERHQGSKYRIVHEELGYNYNYGNAGSGHAHHHSGSPFAPEAEEQTGEHGRRAEVKPPVPGSPGTAQLLRQTWLPDREREAVVVSWLSDSFLQVDPSDVTPSHPAICNGSLTAEGGLQGSVELSARLDADRRIRIEVKTTGVFSGVKYELVTHPNGVVSLHFREPLEWIVPGQQEDFEISLDGAIITKEKELTRERTD